MKVQYVVAGPCIGHV